MKRANTIRVPGASAFALFLLTASAPAHAITQTITLQPGWNAVWLEVQPTNNSASAVFGNLPVASVWSRAERISSVDFIQNPSEATFNESGWLAWLPSWRTESFLNNLFAVFANRAYLLRCTNTTPVVWNITGRPSLRQPTWVPDAFNLRGAPVDPAAPPTFLNFFRHSPAHYNPASSQLQKIYRLNSTSGQWQLVAPTDAVQSGAAYWVYSQGASEFLAPLTAQVEIGDGLEFGDSLTELRLRLRNLTPSTANALVRELNTPTSILSHYQFSPTLGVQWAALPNPLAVAVANGVDTRLRLAARRQDLSGNSYASVVEIRDGAGTRLLLPVSVEKFTDIAGAGEVAGAGGAEPLAGLWVGTATINAVSEAHSANPTNPTPTKSELNLRLLLHVDASGQTRLLKEVIQMWRNGTFTNDSSGNRVVDKPGEYVLLTDDTLIPMFSGATLRDGESVGRRVSTIGYDFPSGPTNNFLNLAGAFAIGQSLTATLTLPHDHPTNPFKHKYHPDHDNLNARFDGPAVESYTTSRQIELSFAGSPPAGSPSVPDFGYNEMGGAYRERITGIHKNPIHLRGTFRLSRVSQIAELNPSPTP
ncbi:MAG: hypothetical protein KJ070_21425 [Verrucomicrobia bacterium]|nr:hypothetical protein [Verrucomicrobiota bacterium]